VCVCVCVCVRVCVCMCMCVCVWVCVCVHACVYRESVCRLLNTRGVTVHSWLMVHSTLKLRYPLESYHTHVSLNIRVLAAFWVTAHSSLESWYTHSWVTVYTQILSHGTVHLLSHYGALQFWVTAHKKSTHGTLKAVKFRGDAWRQQDSARLILLRTFDVRHS